MSISQIPNTFEQRKSQPEIESERKSNRSHLDYSLSLQQEDAKSQSMVERSNHNRHRESDNDVIQFPESNFNFQNTKNNFFKDETQVEVSKNAKPQEVDAAQHPLQNPSEQESNGSSQNENNQLIVVQQENYQNEQDFRVTPIPNYANEYSSMPQQIHQTTPTQFTSPNNGYYQQAQVVPIRYDETQQQHKKKKRRDSDSDDSFNKRPRYNQPVVQPVIVCNADPIAVNLGANITAYCCLGMFNRNDNCCQWMCDCLIYFLTFPIKLMKMLIDCLWGGCLKNLCSKSCPDCHYGCTQACGALAFNAGRCCNSLRTGANNCCMHLLDTVCHCINFNSIGNYIAYNCKDCWKKSGGLFSSLLGAIGSCCVLFGEKFSECCCYMTNICGECCGDFFNIFGDLACKLCELLGACLKCL